jgi:hypothetical protein
MCCLTFGPGFYRVLGAVMTMSAKRTKHNVSPPPSAVRLARGNAQRQSFVHMHAHIHTPLWGNFNSLHNVTLLFSHLLNAGCVCADIKSLTMKFLGTRVAMSSSKNFLLEVTDGE